MAALIDHTLLKPDASRADVETLCREAREFSFASVCVNPTWVSSCRDWLTDAQAKVCCVVGFPLGATTSETKAYEARLAVEQGAREIDMVINLGALKSQDWKAVERDIAAVTAVCHDLGALTKVILETGLLTDPEKERACSAAMAAGADFVKTSTGFGHGGATVADVALMRRVVGERTGVKASGGVRNLAALTAMVDAGATRIGTSAGVAIVREARGEQPGAGPGAY